MPTFSSSTIPAYAGKWLIWSGAFELALAIGFAVAGVAVPAARFGFFLTAFILGLTGVAVATWGRRFAARAAEAERIDATGIPGRATVVGLTQTGMFLNENPQVEMDLRVEVSGRPAFQAQRKEFVPLILLNRLSVGAQLPVKVDPADPSKVVIDWDASPGPSGGPPNESLTEVREAVQASGLQAAQPFASAEQGSYTIEQLRAHLRVSGLAGLATIEELEDSGRMVGDERLFSMEVTVDVPGRPPHRSPRSAALVPLQAVGKVAVGVKIPVRVDPENPDVVMFEWDKA
jgi:hypothetical protein